MKEKIVELVPIVALSLIPTLLIWLPFFLKLSQFWSIPLPQNGMATIVSNFDGPLFMVVAKSFYSTDIINTFEFSLPDIYYSAHYPLFPILIRSISYITNLPYALLLVTLVSSILSLYFFRKFISEFVKKDDVVWMTFVFAILPARWLIVRSVGSAEPLFISSVIASVYYFRKEKYLYSGLWGVVAQMTKSPGILLFLAFLGALIAPSLKNIALTSFSTWFKRLKLNKTWPIFLIPTSLLGLFYFYGLKYGDFFAYFNSGDNIHLFFPPFQIFNYSAPWVGTFWLEEVIFVYLFGVLGLLQLIQKKYYTLAWFVGIFFITILFVAHRDVIRYSLPIVPFLLAGWSEHLVKRDFKIVMALIFIPIYLFSLSYISQNVMPISDWAPFL